MDVANSKLMELARKVYKSCHAYNKFLNSKGIKNEQGLPKNFRKIPLINKKNYLEAFDIEKRLYRGTNLAESYMICSSSGSTGNPTIWPRNYEQDENAINFNKNMYQELFGINNKNTLVVVTFGLGAWTAGMFTSRLCWETAKTNKKLSVVTPGLDKIVAFKLIKELSKYYDQTIITGYPPFVIDLLEYGIEEGFDFKKVNTKIHYTSARLLEDQRDELVRIVSKNENRHDVLGFYACSEAGIIGIETPETVDILKYAFKDKLFSKALFGNPIPPTFITYNPNIRYLEEHNGRIVITVDQVIPLIRYDTRDRGGIFDGKFLAKICKDFGYKVSKSLLDKNFAFVFGRVDSVRLLNNVYIEDVQYCLKKSKFESRLTGNFKYGLEKSGLRSVLKVIVYLKKDSDIDEDGQKEFSKEFYKNLLEVNPDFRMVDSGIKFNFNISFSHETEKEYVGGKFKYFL